MRHMSQSEEFTVLSRHPTLPPRIYYTCMNYWMQLGLLRDLLHLHELVNGNLAFISDRSVGAEDRRAPFSVMCLARPRGVRAEFPLERSRAKIGAQQKQLGSLELSK